METIYHQGTRISPHNAHTSCIKNPDNVVQVHPESYVITQTGMPPPLVGAPPKLIVTMLKPAWKDEVKPTERGYRGHVTSHDLLRAMVCSH